jgi:molybdopterin-guanine dinucleotide biosynthesis protein A
VAVVSSCDVPLLRGVVVRTIVEAVRSPGVRWAVPHVLGHPQVLLSAVAVDLLAEIEAAVAAGVSSPRAVLAAVAAADPRAVVQLDASRFRNIDPDLESFLDIDTPDDLARLESRPIPPSPC